MRPVGQDALRERVERWNRVVQEIENGHLLTIYEYTNDLDLRHEIRRLAESWLPDGATAKRLDEIDSRFRAVTIESDDCVWGEDNARDYHWLPTREWYYWRLPRALPEDFW